MKKPVSRLRFTPPASSLTSHISHPTSRCPSLLHLAVCLLLVVPPVSLTSSADDKTDQEHLEDIHTQGEVDKAIAKGLEYLVKQQQAEGQFKGSMPNTFTALASMALMAAGQIPGQSRYGDNLHRGIMYLVRNSKQHKGYFGNEGNARMYGHGICTLALCEAYGMMEKEEDNHKVKEAIERALKIILYAQAQKDRNKGGWRYEPKPRDADLSVTVWQILALRSAKNCQLEVPDKTIQTAKEYVIRTFNHGQKGFSYHTGGGNASPAMRAAGTVALLALGAQRDEKEDEKDMKLIRESASFLKTFDPKSASHYYYTCYYLATAANMVGPELRKTFLPRLEKTLMKLQNDRGEFSKHSGHQGGVYSTAFAVLCLCAHYQYLPIYQE